MTAITDIDATSDEDVVGVGSEPARSTVPVARRSCQFGVESAFNRGALRSFSMGLLSSAGPGTCTGLFLLRMSLDMSAQDVVYLASVIQTTIPEPLDDV